MMSGKQAASLYQVQAAHPQRYPFLLESVAHGPVQARYDILLAFPGDRLELSGDGVLRLNQELLEGQAFLPTFDERWKREGGAGRESANGLPFSGGWFVYIGYEMADQIEPGLRLVNRPGFPKALAVRIPAAIIFDHQTRQITCFTEDGHPAMRDQMRFDLETAPDIPASSGFNMAMQEDDGELFLRDVERIKRYIREGDVFQVNLSRLWKGSLERERGMLSEKVTALDLYRSLRRSNPGPFNGLALLSDTQAVVSSSPERLVNVRGGRVSVRPIAGTYPRGLTTEQDRILSEQLTRHPKEKAEHIMLIDLERNDLGRICQPGSVKVDELMSVETYKHVHHIVSEVSGRLQTGIGPADVIRAVFPGGTITGCPKVRCMEIIAELEQAWRGPYTGSMGYINHNGDMDLNILIRSMVVDGDQLSFRAGGGIVHDSIPHRELEETRAKARGMVRGLQVA